MSGENHDDRERGGPESGDRAEGEREFDADSGFGPLADEYASASDDDSGRDASDRDAQNADAAGDADAPDPSDGDATDAAEGTEAGAGAGDAYRRMRSALGEVRREGRKVAFLYALLDAGLVALAVNLVLRLFRPAALGDAVSLPAAVAGAGGVVPETIHVASVVGLAVGVVAFAAEFLLRTRRPLVEQFEAANPPVREALRTARDAVDDGADTEMARHLYDDVIGRLRETSSFELVETRRVVVTSLLVVVVSLASIHVAVVDLDLTDTFDGGDDAGGSDAPPPDDRDEEEGLQDGDQILGDPENVSAGDESINASVQGTGSGEGDAGSTSPASSYDDGGFADAAVESQQAGYAESENVEDAELIREYNLQIRERDDRDEDDR